MDRIPNELRSLIVRLLPDEDDRDALVAAYPDWEGIVEHENSLRALKFDPAGEEGLVLKDFTELFEEEAIRRRQFLQEVEVRISLDGKPGCCPAGRKADLEAKEFSKGIRSILKALHEISQRLANETELALTPMRLALTSCENSDQPRTCQSHHSAEQSLTAELYEYELCLGLPDDLIPELKGVDEFYFWNRDLLRYLDPGFLPALVKRLVDLRVLNLDFDEDIRWSRGKKDEWRNSIPAAVAAIPNTLPLEEFRLCLDRSSPRNEFIQPSHWSREWVEDNQATLMFRHLSTFRCLGVLRLSGQFCIPVDFFDTLGADPFPALTVFYLGIGPDTACGDWFFVKDETEQAWDKAAEDPDCASALRLIRQGMLPSDPVPEREPESDEEGYWAYMDAKAARAEFAFLDPEPELRNRTLPNDATMGPMLRGAAGAVAKMARIESFSVVLADDFDADDGLAPFVPSFLTREFELRYDRKARGKTGSTLVWKLGHKIDHWRPAEDVLAAWKAATREDRDLEMSFIE